MFLHHYDEKDTIKQLIYDKQTDLPVPTRDDGYVFSGWFYDEEGTNPFVNGTEMKQNFHLYAHWTAKGAHTSHDFGDSYFAYVKCSGCDVVGRNAGTRNYENAFDYIDQKQEVIDGNYSSAKNALNGDVSAFVDALLLYEEDLEYLDGQYSWATLYDNVQESFDYGNIIQSYNIALANFCQMILDANQKFGDSFWDLYPDDKEETLAMATLYVNTPDESDIDSILDDYYYGNYTDINTLYKSLVDAYNKEAQSYLPGSNYMEYAYSEIYNREYDEEDIKTMRSYIKSYIVPIYQQVDAKLGAMYTGGTTHNPKIKLSNTANTNFYDGLMSKSVVKSSTNATVRNTVNYISEYFAWLDNSNVCQKPVSFTNAVNDMFRTGKYFQGSYEGAYTLWVPHDEVSVCFFSPDYYDTAFTFVHELGHYYENCHNGGVALSYDHDETQSQGNEMLFLAWLKQNKPNDITDGMTAVELEEVSSLLSIIILSAAVDELEWAAYKGEVTSNFQNKFEQILESYLGANHNFDKDYWYYVVFDSAAYYVSYAISALPAVEIYAIAQQQGLEAARTAYLKLFGYCEDNARMKNYSYTETGGVLGYCGLGNPFQTKLYEDITSYFNSVSW